MTERDYGAIARDAAYSFGRLVGRGAKAGHHQLEVFLGGPDRTKVILILAAVLGLSGADAATVGAAATELTKALHISQADIGLLVAVTSLVAAAASVPFGVLADKAPRTRTLGVTIFLWGAVMLWSATASSFGHLLASRAVLGVVTAAAGPIVASLVGDLFGGDERGRIYGYILTGEMVGGGVGFAVTGDVAALSWRAAFVILAIPAFLLAWSVIRLPEPARTGGRGRRPGRSPDGAPPFRPGPWTPPPDDSPPGAARGTYRPSSTGPLPVGPPGGRPTPPGGSPTPPPAGSTPP
ncbi:MAG TPA: MFS transporter, partial [Actinomycetota bacterium]|nr:MFS transporter [Actinomycetota bacterium]